MVGKVFLDAKKVAFFNIKQKLKACANPNTGFIKHLKTVASAYPELKDSPLKTLEFIPSGLRHSIKKEGYKEEKAYKVLFKTQSKELRSIIHEYPMILNHARVTRRLFTNFDYYIRYLNVIKDFFGNRRATHIHFESNFRLPEQIQFKLVHELEKYKVGIDKEIKYVKTVHNMDEVIATTAYDYEYFQDSFNLLIQIIAANSEFKLDSYKSLKEMHDGLSKIQRELEFKDKIINYNDEDYKINFEYKGYSFKLLNTKMQFWETGEKLRNCVASYFDYAEMGRNKIVVAYKGEDPKICIELKSNRIVQARLNCNERVNSDEECLEALNAWIKEKKLARSNDEYRYF